MTLKFTQIGKVKHFYDSVQKTMKVEKSNGNKITFNELLKLKDTIQNKDGKNVKMVIRGESARGSVTLMGYDGKLLDIEDYYGNEVLDKRDFSHFSSLTFTVMTEL